MSDAGKENIDKILDIKPVGESGLQVTIEGLDGKPTSFVMDCKRDPKPPCIHKLIRDRIHFKYPDNKYILLKTSDELLEALKAKLLEEAQEVVEAVEQPHLLEELGDVFEVLRALAETSGASIEDVIRCAEMKREKKGGFTAGIVWIKEG